MKKTPLAALLALAATLVLLAACGGAKKSNPNWIHEDDVRLAVDETFQPIVQNMVETFGMQHPEATMLPTYVSEDSAIRMLVRDSVRLIIATRPLTDDERKVVEAHSLGVKTNLIATDAIALVVNKSVADTLITLDRLWEQMVEKERCAAVAQAMRALPDEDREIFYRFYDLSQTAAQIAEDLQLNASTVRSRLMRGRRTLRGS